jgi:hypothetical protein
MGQMLPPWPVISPPDLQIRLASTPGYSDMKHQEDRITGPLLGLHLRTTKAFPGAVPEPGPRGFTSSSLLTQLQGAAII